MTGSNYRTQLTNTQQNQVTQSADVCNTQYTYATQHDLLILLLRPMSSPLQWLIKYMPVYYEP